MQFSFIYLLINVFDLLFAVSCSADMTARLWDFQGYECVKTMRGFVNNNMQYTLFQVIVSINTKHHNVLC